MVTLSGVLLIKTLDRTWCGFYVHKIISMNGLLSFLKNGDAPTAVRKTNVLPKQVDSLQSVSNIVNSHLFGVNCVYNITLNGCDRHTAEALHELSCEYHALRFAIDRLITIIDKKGGAL